MQKFAHLVIITVLLIGNCHFVFAQDWNKIRIGTEGKYPPFNNLNAGGDLVGFEIDIAEALCKELNAECEFVIQDWEGMIPALLDNKFDAIIASMAITDERKEMVDFSTKYYNTPPAIAVPTDSTIAGASEESLAGFSLGALQSTTHAKYAEFYFSESDIKLFATSKDYEQELASGQLDAVIDDVVVLNEWLKSSVGACCRFLTILRSDLKINGVGAGVAVRKEDATLRDKFSNAIAKIRENGTYRKINDKYFAFDAFGD